MGRIMGILAIVIAIVLGYVIGLLQNGIRVYHDVPPVKNPEKRKYNKSVGLEEFTDYYEETGGVNKF